MDDNASFPCMISFTVDWTACSRLELLFFPDIDISCIIRCKLAAIAGHPEQFSLWQGTEAKNYNEDAWPRRYGIRDYIILLFSSSIATVYALLGVFWLSFWQDDSFHNLTRCTALIFQIKVYILELLGLHKWLIVCVSTLHCVILKKIVH